MLCFLSPPIVSNHSQTSQIEAFQLCYFHFAACVLSMIAKDATDNFVSLATQTLQTRIGGPTMKSGRRGVCRAPGKQDNESVGTKRHSERNRRKRQKCRDERQGSPESLAGEKGPSRKDTEHTTNHGQRLY